MLLCMYQCTRLLLRSGAHTDRPCNRRRLGCIKLQPSDFLIAIQTLYSPDAQQQSMRWAVFVFCVCICVRLSSCLPLCVLTVIDVSLWSHCALSFKPPSFFFPSVGHGPLQTHNDTLRTGVMHENLFVLLINHTTHQTDLHTSVDFHVFHIFN